MNGTKRRRGVERPGEAELRTGPIVATVRRLHQRIEARFPERHLLIVCGELEALVVEIAAGRAVVRRRTSRLRRICRVLEVALVVAVVWTVGSMVAGAVGTTRVEAVTWPSLVESSVNDVVFVGVAVWFLHLLPERIQRRRILRMLHRLRSLAHVIDMHQLTKDPERIRSRYRRTKASVPESMTAEELFHYLDYCSEMLSLVSKSAAVYGQSSEDDLVLASIEGVEALTTGMQTKIWQKISMLSR